MASLRELLSRLSGTQTSSSNSVKNLERFARTFGKLAAIKYDGTKVVWYTPFGKKIIAVIEDYADYPKEGFVHVAAIGTLVLTKLVSSLDDPEECRKIFGVDPSFVTTIGNTGLVLGFDPRKVGGYVKATVDKVFDVEFDLQLFGDLAKGYNPNIEYLKFDDLGYLDK